MLEVRGLSVNYGSIRALKNVSFTVEEGEIITLIGSNGAGKTSSLMAISGLVGKSGGTVTFEGKDITSMSPDKIARQGICHVPEGRKIFSQLTVYENLVAGTMGNPTLSRSRQSDLMEEVFDLFPRLREREKQAGGTLSGGEQQMLAIARGLMMDPDIIMLDEPSLGLAPIMVQEIFDLIDQIHRRGKTILLIEQNGVMALSAADRGYVMEAGEIILTGKGQELLNDPAVRKAYLGA